jgi:transposase
VDAWLKSLPRRDRKVAKFLALGNRTRDAAAKFGVSDGMISKLRSSLERSWNDFTGGTEANTA